MSYPESRQFAQRNYDRAAQREERRRRHNDVGRLRHDIKVSRVEYEDPQDAREGNFQVLFPDSNLLSSL